MKNTPCFSKLTFLFATSLLLVISSIALPKTSSAPRMGLSLEEVFLLASAVAAENKLVPRYQEAAQIAKDEAQLAKERGKVALANYLEQAAFALNQAALAFSKRKLDLVPLYEQAAEYAQEAARAEKQGQLQLANSFFQTSLSITGKKLDEESYFSSFFKKQTPALVKNLATANKKEIQLSDYQQQLTKVSHLAAVAKLEVVANAYQEAANYAEQAVEAHQKRNLEQAYYLGQLSAVIEQLGTAQEKNRDRRKLELALSYSRESLSTKDNQRAELLSRAVQAQVTSYSAEAEGEKEVAIYSGQLAFALSQASKVGTTALVNSYLAVANFAEEAVAAQLEENQLEAKYLFLASLALGRSASALRQGREDLISKYKPVINNSTAALAAQRSGSITQATYLYQLAFSEGEAIWRMSDPRLVRIYNLAVDYAQQALAEASEGKTDLAKYLYQASFSLSQFASSGQDLQLAKKSQEAYNYARLALEASQKGDLVQARKAYQTSSTLLPAEDGA